MSTRLNRRCTTAFWLGSLFLGWQYYVEILGDVLAQDLEHVVLVGGDVVVNKGTQGEGDDTGYASAQLKDCRGGCEKALFEEEVGWRRYP